MRRVVGTLAAVAVAGVGLATPASAAEARDIDSACPAALVPDSGFTDLGGLPEGFVAAIDCIVGYGVTQGTTADTFSPGGAVTRGQMATFLLHLLETTTGWTAPTEPADAFGDDNGTTHETSINAIASASVAKGTGEGTFSPSTPVKRDQMATFVAATLKAAGATLPASAPDAFADDNGSVHAPNIDALAALGVVSGTGTSTYGPAQLVARRQMALFLARGLDVLVDAGAVRVPFGGVSVGGEAELLQVGQDRTCLVGSQTGTLNLLVLPSSAVTVAEDGTTVFADVDEDGLADQSSVAPWMGSVDGSSRPADTRATSLKSDGDVPVTLSSLDEGDIVLVAFIDAAGRTAGKLDLDLHGAPVDDAAVGCATAWIPPEALLGTNADVLVETVNIELGYFTGTPTGSPLATYFFDADNDTYAGKATDRASFDALLSFGDVLDVDYEPDPEGVSTFTTKTDTVRPPGEPSVTAVNADEGTTLNDMRVSFAVPPYNGAGTTYRVTRIKTFKGEDGCDGTFTSQALSIGTADASPYIDMNVADGCYAYQVWALSSTGATKASTVSADAESGLPLDTVRPRSQAAEVFPAGGDLGPGDEIKIRFDERMAEPEAGDTITLSNGGTSITLTDGSGADFGLNVGEDDVGGVTVPRGWVLIVDVTSAPSISFPATITGHSGVSDLAGNSWDISASADKTLE